MNITTINQLVSVNITLERDEAIAALDDPSDLQAQLRQALGDDLDTGGPLVHVNGRKGPKGRATRKVASTRGRAQKRILCPHCPRTYTSRGYLDRHLLRAHNDAQVAVA